MKKFIEMNDKIPLVLVDDIMYLRSMRKQVYLIFKQLHIKILTVYVTVSLSLAIERNNHRDSSNVVNTESIIKIANAFEPPAEEFVHDRNHVIIDNTSTET
jgi:tRNA uridine 5-carbamoylmethylation protein Kti12